MMETLQRALNEALADEYKARAIYRLILSRFGAVRPFVNIVESEERHIQALLPLFRKYDIPIPVDDWEQRVEIPASLQAACRAGVEAEIENAEMYQRLLASTRDYPDVQRVFLNLQQASQENHLPAFQRCAERHADSESDYGMARNIDLNHPIEPQTVLSHPGRGKHQRSGRGGHRRGICRNPSSHPGGNENSTSRGINHD
ncbi:ferritin-like domain-containing protein [Egbenema bharatensis]|uniref:ferritin-like domain-containing protein n=1 Tax=Egbenema bharatensis TaxID=3463334 RepID=UPI003A8B53B5